MATFGPKAYASEVADAFASEIEGKTVLITGVSPNSIGAETALEIAKHKAKLIILAGRSAEKLNQTAESIKNAAPSVQTRTVILDLASQKRTRKAAEEVNSFSDPINILINSAGVMATPYKKSEDGIELQFAACHVGHFLFTNLIMPKILASGSGARIINITSDGHRLGPVRFDDINFQDGQVYDKWESYGQAKSANCLFTRSLASKLGGKGLLSFSVHPGIVSTNLGDHLGEDEDWDKIAKTLNKTITPESFKTLAQGASSYMVAAFNPNIAKDNGSYFEEGSIRNDLNKDWAKDPENSEKLWKLTEGLVGQKFEY